MGWLYLALAILLEVAGTTCMKLSEGLTRLIPSVFMFASYALCFASLSLALTRIDLSIAYAVWCGIGMAVITVIGIIFFQEPVTIRKLFSIMLITVGVVGLHLSSV